MFELKYTLPIPNDNQKVYCNQVVDFSSKYSKTFKNDFLFKLKIYKQKNANRSD